MVTHKETRDTESRIKCYVISVFLLRTLRLTSYHQEKKVGPLSSEEIFLGRILLHMFMVQDMNSHPIFGLESNPHSVQIGLETIGSAIYPIVGSYFNHSCSPNTLRVNVGRTQMLISSSRISSGDEITDIYSMHFSEILREKRQWWLNRNFNFVCKCEGCEKNWEIFENLPTKVSDQLRSKLQMVETAIAQAIRSDDFKLTLQLHLRQLGLLEGLEKPHTLHVLIRNSFQFACWRYYGKMAENRIILS
ncbi:uncharacterized protein LOC111698475 [Eurytemora carolleeae]|uniref:uncharacterized protein LOC111698475 n=1 Tax=Eurytemora carolleeae TaxID=1294199 RepID=UPI000C7593CB|nr:uncharacterized protein LOC111698475 [Eurytemora carolleeae]|eukprot:XP_023324593.1 uncharacterized protein LOC111698475 [Eurytemora affinis]